MPPSWAACVTAGVLQRYVGPHTRPIWDFAPTSRNSPFCSWSTPLVGAFWATRATPRKKMSWRGRKYNSPCSSSWPGQLITFPKRSSSGFVPKSRNPAAYAPQNVFSFQCSLIGWYIRAHRKTVGVLCESHRSMVSWRVSGFFRISSGSLCRSSGQI